MDTDEVVYGSTMGDDSHVMSERVQSLASSVYQEFERMIKKYDEDVVKELMPLVVGILETLDNSFLEKQETEVELELLRDDNEQLLTQYEREKQLRKGIEQKYLEGEDTLEDERRDFQNKIESLESMVRMLELKARNTTDHVIRLEDKEADMKKEYTKLHERYTELLRTHMDHIERTKMFVGADKILEMGASPRTRGFQMPNLRPVGSSAVYGGVTPDKVSSSPPNFPQITSPRGHEQLSTLKHELKDLEKGEAEGKLDSKENKELRNKNIDGETKTQTAEKEQNTDNIDLKTTSTCMTESMQSPESDGGKSHPMQISGKKNGNDASLFDELSVEDAHALGDVDDGCDITGMSKEVENLILENTELLATKNALNVVKDDLIAKVDELTSEQEILREEITALQTSKDKLRKRVSELEDDLKKVREELEKEKTKKPEGEEEQQEEVPMSQRKRFTRVEMARVLMERNQYKERLMELQEAVRWTEMIRASREHPELVKDKKKGSIWNFFGGLVGGGSSASAPNTPQSTPTPKAQKGKVSKATIV